MERIVRLQLPPITLTFFLWLLTTTVVAEEPVAPLTFVKTWGQEGSGNGEFEFPIGIAIHEQTIFVTDHYNHRVQIFDKQGKFLAKFGEYGVQPGKFFAPHTLAFNSRGDLFIVDSFNQRIQKFATR